MAGTNCSTSLARQIQTAIRSKLNNHTPPAPPHPPPASPILRHLEADDLPAAISLMKSTHSQLPALAYARLLSLCARRNSLVDARRVESHLISTSSPSPPPFLLDLAIRTYSLLGSLRDAHELFDEMPHRTPHTHNTLIAAYLRASRPHDSLPIFLSMRRHALPPTEPTFALVLSACADLSHLHLTTQVHASVEKSVFRTSITLGTALVDAYGKCGVISDARRAFELIVDPSAISWNVIIRRYFEADDGAEAVGLFFRMLGEAVRPLSFTVSNTLKACSDVSALAEGRQVHGFVAKVGYGGDSVVENALMEMYSKCGVLEDAYRVFEGSTSKNVVSWTLMVSRYVQYGSIDVAELLFDEMPQRDVVSWNAMLGGYARFSRWEEALGFFRRMRRETREIDTVTLGLLLNVCAGLSDLDKGKQVHGFAYRHGFSASPFFSSALLDMYSKCGSLRGAEIWFDHMATPRDRMSWNSLLTGYACNARSEEAFNTFREMQQETNPNGKTLSIMLAACANTFSLKNGKEIHGYILRYGIDTDVVTRGALVDMYSKCRLIEYAIRVFEGDTTRDLSLWNSIILGCAHNRRGRHGLMLFEAMEEGEIKPDNATFTGVLLACTGEGYVKTGRRYFDSMVTEYGVIPRVEHYECMIELLGKNGRVVELEDFIQKMPFDPTIGMWKKVFDCCREHGNERLRQRAHAEMLKGAC